MRVAFLTTDNREQRNDYGMPEPYFGPAPAAVVNGLGKLDPDVLELHVISCTRRPMPAPEKLAPNVWFHQPQVPKAGWGRSLFAGCGLAVRKVIQSIKPDLVHAQGTERDCAVSMLLSPVSPRILTIHGCMTEMHRKRLQKNRIYGGLVALIESIAARTCDGVVCNTAYTEGLMSGMARQSFRIPNAIRSPFLDTVRTESAPNSVPVLVNVGLLSPYKRQLEILRAVRELRKEGTELRIQFVGDGDWSSEYGLKFQVEMDQAAGEGWAEHLGYRNVDEIIRIFDAADAAVHFPTMETFGLVVAEALARGLKFFGSDEGGVPDVASGAAGAEVHETLESLKAGIGAWVRSGAPRQPEAVGSIRRRFSEEAVARMHLELYREILNTAD